MIVVLLRWVEVLVVWGAVGTMLMALYVWVNLLLAKMEGEDGDQIDL